MLVVLVAGPPVLGLPMQRACQSLNSGAAKMTSLLVDPHEIPRFRDSFLPASPR